MKRGEEIKKVKISEQSETVDVKRANTRRECTVLQQSFLKAQEGSR